jgi:hypothetical protein
VPPHPARTATTAEAVSSALRIARQSVETAIPRPVNSSTYPQRHHGTILPQPGMTPAEPETPEEVEVDTDADDDSDEGTRDE